MCPGSFSNAGTGPSELAELITIAVRSEVAATRATTRYREPLVGFADAGDPRFASLKNTVLPGHVLPEDLLKGARSVVSIFVPFDESIVRANIAHVREVAVKWIVVYLETNGLIKCITAKLMGTLWAYRRFAGR